MFHYLFSFDGRINRAKLWAFILIGILWEIIVVGIAAFGFNLSALNVPAGQHPDMAAVFNGPMVLVAGAAICVLSIAYIWAALAVNVKRLHDRDKSGAWLFVFWVLPFVLEIVGAGWLGTAEAMMGKDHPMSLIGVLFFLGAFVVLVWAFVELYCLRGTDGDNRFGADPLAGKA